MVMPVQTAVLRGHRGTRWREGELELDDSGVDGRGQSRGLTGFRGVSGVDPRRGKGGRGIERDATHAVAYLRGCNPGPFLALMYVDVVGDYGSDTEVPDEFWTEFTFWCIAAAVEPCPGTAT
ncbi:hypothetical protein JB92DRAFT_432548 [Gautieria morchelliformis]|nr:hypothetical protein JB92DRAFT_432548 [Gautieria morchelliformis]